MQHDSKGTRHCPRCGSTDTDECSHAKMPYRCRDCRKYFSIKTSTVMVGSPLPLLMWVYAIHLDATLKGVSSMKLHRDLGITQKMAWLMLQRIREACAKARMTSLKAQSKSMKPTWLEAQEHEQRQAGGTRMNGAQASRQSQWLEAKQRNSNKVSAKAVESTDAQTLIPLDEFKAADSAAIYTGGTSVCLSLPASYNGHSHESVNHSICEYVKGDAHTNSVESFWAMLKRPHKGTFHKFSPKHLNRCVKEFSRRRNIRGIGALRPMVFIASGLLGRLLPYEKLIADNGLDSFARS